MRRLAIVLAVTIATAGFAGCLGGDDSGSSTSAQPTSATSNETNASTTSSENETVDTGPDVKVVWHNGSVQGQRVPGLGPLCYLDCGSIDFAFEVSDNASAIVAELAWNASTTMTLDLDIPFDKCEAGPTQDCPPESKSGESVLVQRITSSQSIKSGGWNATVFADNSPTQSVSFTATVSIFQGDPVPSDYGKLS